MPNLDTLYDAVDSARDEIVSILCELIRFPSVNTGVMPTGNELPICHFLRDTLAAEGIGSCISESAENRGNLVARLPGSRGRPRLLLMAHLDVVPIDDESQWIYPPFGGTVAEGRVWGRGAADMKDLLTAELMTCILLKRAGAVLGGDLILAAAADEETGGHYGFGWLAQNTPDAIRAEFALNEGGGAPIRAGERLAYIVPVGEKGRLELHIAIHGKATHAATPWLGDNAVVGLAEVLRRIESYQPEIDLSQEFFSLIQPVLLCAKPITAESVDALAAENLIRHPYLGSAIRGFSRMTLVPTMLSAGVKSNSVPASASLVCDVRTLPDQDEAYVRRQVDRLLNGLPGVTYELVTTAASSASPYDTELAEALRQVTKAVAGREDILFVPGLTLGFTDSRLVRPFGTVTYGFHPGHPGADPNVPSNTHGANESTDITSLLFRIKVLIGVACHLLGV